MQPSDCKTCERMASTPARRPYAEDLTGQRFGKLTVESLACIKPRHWFCKCSCGDTFLVEGGNLKRGHARSCRKCSRHSGVPTYAELRAKKREGQDASTN
jgi:hypothetical protein